MLLFTCHLLFDHFQFTLIHGSNIPGSYALLFFTATDFTSINSHIHSWALFLLWLCLFILSGVISPLFSSSILGTYWPGKFIFQCNIFLPFHTVHGVLMAKILKWFAIPSPVVHVLSELFTVICLSWVALHGMAHSFTELDKAVTPQEIVPDLPVGVWESPAEVWVGGGLLQGWEHWGQQGMHGTFWRGSTLSSLPPA